MKQTSKLDGQARIFSKALQSALGSATLSRTDRVASKENLKIAEAKIAPTTDLNRHKSNEIVTPSFENPNQMEINGNFFDNDVVETNQSLLKSTSDPHSWMEMSNLSTVQETWEENWKIPEAINATTTHWPNMYETKCTEVMSSSFENSDQMEINSNEYCFSVSHVSETNPSWLTSPSDLHCWIENSHLASIQEALCMVTNNENDVWIKNNRLMALQQLDFDSPDQYSSSTSFSSPDNIDSTGEISSDTMYNPPDYGTLTILPQSPRNSLSTEYNSVKDIPIYDGKYKFKKHEKPLVYQQEEMKLECPQGKSFSSDQKSTRENSKFPSGEQFVCMSDGSTEFVCKNTDQAFEKSYPEGWLKNIPVKNSKIENSSHNCCGIFHDKPSAKNKKNVAILPSYDVTSLMALESTTGFFDSHCHIDFLLNRENFVGTYTDYIAQHKGSYPKSYNGCIAVFCKPFTFAKKYLWEKHLEQDNVWGAFGCHPKSAKFYDDKIEKDLEVALNHPKVKALGEIGLDYSIGNEYSKLEQHFIFRRQLRIAQRRNLRLVIHCRDADDDAIKIMHEVIPKDTIFHLHCFTSTWERAQIWMEEFPNVFIGITNLVTFPSAADTHEVARELPLESLLLETDAPYFVPTMAPKSTSFSHPGMAIHVAAQIAALKNIPVDKVLQWTSANTKIVYNIP